MGCLLLHVSNSLAQIPGAATNLQSPNTASLGLYGEVPVSYFTGIPNIEIPLYTLKENDIEVPITMRYHASGVRPDMHPGWVGMGWALEAGGVITRIVKDQPDDYKNTSYDENALGLWYTQAAVNVPNWDQTSYMYNAATDLTNNFRDVEPDEFSFSFPGCSGKFFLDETGHWKVQCDKPVVVTFNGVFFDVPIAAPSTTLTYNIGNSQSFSGFTITDEDGTQYVFGQNTNAIEYDMAMFNQSVDEWAAEAWYLTKIIHADGYEVDFNYEKDDYISQLGIYMSLDIGTSAVKTGGFLESECSSTSFDNIFFDFAGGKLISPSYLRSITCSGGNSILFNRSTSTELSYNKLIYDTKYAQWYQVYGQDIYHQFMPFLETSVAYPGCLSKLQWKKLDGIQIKDANGTLRKGFQFTYNNVATERLTLLSLAETGQNGGTKPPYQFSYITDGPKPLPDYLACQTDHWGFFNGTVPDLSDPNNYYKTFYDYRNTHPEYLQTGTLNKIVYPTGGVTEFTYEPNTYGKRLQINRTDGIDPYFNTNTVAGGLRIRKITSYDPNSTMPPKTKEYFYVSGYNNTLDATQVSNLPSSGVLGGQIQYYFDDYRTKASNDNNIVYSKKLFSNQSILPGCTNSAGTHIGYSEVVEKSADGSYTKYYYTNFDNGHLDEPVPCLQITRTPYEPATSLEVERGLVYKQEAYNNNNVAVYRKETSYLALNKSTEYSRALNLRCTGICGPGTVLAEGVAYRNYTYSYLPNTETVTQYDANGGNGMVTQRQFAYDDHRQMRWGSFTDSKGQTTTTRYRYPYDALGYTPSADPGINEVTAYMVKHNQIGSPMETIDSKLILGREYITDSKLTTYNVYPGMIKPFRTYKFITSAPASILSYTNYTVTGYSGGNEAVSMDYRLNSDMTASAYDNRGNVTSFARDKDVTTTRLWNYNKNYPVADILNADVSQVAYTSFETDDWGGWTKLSGDTKLNDGNVTGIKSFSGVFTATVPSSVNYRLTLWGKAGALQTVNGHGGTVKKVAGNFILYEWLLYNPSTVTVTSDNCDEVRLIPEGASIATYTYDQFVGMTTKTDWNNLSIFYEYDEFGRLHFVRDHDKNLVKKINYNYRGGSNNVYYNAPYVAESHIKECSAAFPVNGQYIVPAGRYSSVISPDEANNLAKQDGDKNGYTWVQQNTPCEITSLSVDYMKDGNVPFTVKFENLMTHAVFTWSFSAPGDWNNQIFPHLGNIPSGRYDVTISTTSTAGHTFILGGLGQNGTSSATFSNALLIYPQDAFIIINGNL